MHRDEPWQHHQHQQRGSPAATNAAAAASASLLTQLWPQSTTTTTAAAAAAVGSALLDPVVLTMMECCGSCQPDAFIMHALQTRINLQREWREKRERFRQQQPPSVQQTTNVAGSDPVTAASSSSSSSSSSPALLLCAFKQSPQHYAQIARKWGLNLASLHSQGELYLMQDMEEDEAQMRETSRWNGGVANASVGGDEKTSLDRYDAQLDRWFDVEEKTCDDDDAASTAGPAHRRRTPLSSFLSRLLSLRRRHESLCILIDDWNWIIAHTTSSIPTFGGGPDRATVDAEMEALDGLMALKQRMEDMERKRNDTTTFAARTSSSTSSFALSSSPPVAPQPLPSSLLLAVAGDLAFSPVHLLLRRHSSTLLRLSPLQTGWDKEISGVLTVVKRKGFDDSNTQHVQQHDANTSHSHSHSHSHKNGGSGILIDYVEPAQRWHYKLTEGSIKIKLPGHSSDSLQQ